MKVIIMCGGKGTRLREETVIKPKPMVEIGGRPVLWHIMNIYARFGFKDFILPLGYKGEYIKQYFHDYNIRNTDFTVDLRSGAITPPSPRDRGLARDPVRHRAGDPQGRPPETRGPLHRYRPLHGHLW